jgi:hypothetical protein
MREWTGIQLDTGATDRGAVMVANANFQVGGELRRRAGMVGFTNQSGIAITNFTNQFTGDFAVFATSTGTVEAVAAP